MSKDVYQYISEHNLSGSIGIINKFGYNLPKAKIDANNVGVFLRQLVAQEGEGALKEVMTLHPDKDLILEFFNTTCKCNDRWDKVEHHLSNLTGSNAGSSIAHKTETQNQIYFLGAALLLAAAIIAKT